MGLTIVLAGNPGVPEIPPPDATLPFLVFGAAVVLVMVWIRRKR
jgi:hypothetical protein